MPFNLPTALTWLRIVLIPVFVAIYYLPDDWMWPSTRNWTAMWVFAVAANLARDEARSAIRRKKHLTLLTNEPTQRHQVEADGEENVEHDEKMEKVRIALAELSQRDRDVLLLWDAGLSYPEIAEQSGLAVGAVGTTLARARKRLIEAHDRMEVERKRNHAAQS